MIMFHKGRLLAGALIAAGFGLSGSASAAPHGFAKALPATAGVTLAHGGGHWGGGGWHGGGGHWGGGGGYWRGGRGWGGHGYYGGYGYRRFRGGYFYGAYPYYPYYNDYYYDYPDYPTCYYSRRYRARICPDY
jgi:hypothetical protein